MAAARPIRLRRRAALVLASGLLALSAFSQALAATSATLSVPSEATPGEVITVKGTHFNEGQRGNLTYNGGVIESFRASSAGSFSMAFTIPAKARLGTGRISAKTTSGTLLATTTLTIVSALPSGGPSPSSSAGVSATPSATPSGTPRPSATPTPIPTPSPTPTGGGSGGGSVPSFDHVYVIVFENHEYSSIVGSSSGPFINSLISKYGVSTTFYAETHPSEPNYIALTSGSTQGITDDGTYNLSVPNVFSQLTAAGLSWHAYEQGYPGDCYTGTSGPSVVDGPGLAGEYRRKHDPAISFTSVSGNPSECAKITHLAGFSAAAARFELIVPNLINDMHDGTIADGDNFLKAFLPEITSSSAFTNSVVFVTFDEGSSNTNGGGHIVTIAIPSGGSVSWSSSTLYRHYSILRTIEGASGLSSLGGAGSAATPLFSSAAAATAVSGTTGASVSTPTPDAIASPSPADAPTPTAEAAPTPASTPAWPPGATDSRMRLLEPCPDAANCYLYTVRAAGENGSSVNDDLPSIARYFGVTVESIYALNPGLAAPLITGRAIRIPPPTR